MKLLCRLFLSFTIGIVAVAVHAVSVALNSASSNTVTATIAPDAADIGRTADIWMGAVFHGALYLRNGTAWTLYTNGPLPVAIRAQTLFPSTPVTLVAQLDISALVGLDLYVGYGSSEQDMLSSPGKLAKIHTVPASAAPPVVTQMV